MRFAFRRDLAIGRYVALATPVHRLDPRTKLLGFLAVLLALFRAELAGTVGILAALGFLVALARLPAGQLLGALRALSWILVITIGFQTFWVGPTTLGGLGEGAVVGVWMALRLVGMLAAASLLTFTTEPIRLSDALGRMFGFLERARIPVRSLTMVLTLALRFLPTVLEEAERIVAAQRARGARFEGGLLSRARRLLPLAVPLFAGCLHRADTLALAMEARGYSGSRVRTQLEPLAFSRADFVALAGLAALLLVSFAVGRGG